MVVLFGATGRLGSAIQAKLSSNPNFTVMSIARTARPGVTAMDISQTSVRPAQIAALSSWATPFNQVILIDAILDKSSALAMRRSLAQAADFITETSQALRDQGKRVVLMTASTTAVLSPLGYQTPYGIAKRKQLSRYATAEIPGLAFLFPKLLLSESNSEIQKAHVNDLLAPLHYLPHLTSTYAEAALLIAESANRTHADFRISSPLGLLTPAQPLTFGIRQKAVTLLAVVPLAFAASTFGRNSPQLHRLATYGKLFATPPPLRRRIDHHLAPKARVAKLARRLGLPITFP